MSHSELAFRYIRWYEDCITHKVENGDTPQIQRVPVTERIPSFKASFLLHRRHPFILCIILADAPSDSTNEYASVHLTWRTSTNHTSSHTEIQKSTWWATYQLCKGALRPQPATFVTPTILPLRAPSAASTEDDWRLRDNDDEGSENELHADTTAASDHRVIIRRGVVDLIAAMEVEVELWRGVVRLRRVTLRNWAGSIGGINDRE